jgi:hypothetical protein
MWLRLTTVGPMERWHEQGFYRWFVSPPPSGFAAGYRSACAATVAMAVTPFLIAMAAVLNRQEKAGPGQSLNIRSRLLLRGVGGA